MGTGASKTSNQKTTTVSGSKGTENSNPNRDGARHEGKHSTMGVTSDSKLPEFLHQAPHDVGSGSEEKSTDPSENSGKRNVDSNPPTKSDVDSDPKEADNRSGETSKVELEGENVGKSSDSRRQNSGINTTGDEDFLRDPVQSRDRCLSLIVEVKKLTSKKDYGELYDKLIALAEAFLGIIKAQPIVAQPLLREISDDLISQGVDEMLFTIVIDILDDYRDGEGDVTHVPMKTLSQSVDTLFAFTRVSAPLAENVCERPGLLEILTSDILMPHGVILNMWKTDEGIKLCFNVLLLIYNCSVRYSNRKRLRELGYVWILKKTMLRADNFTAFVASMTLAGILDEEESKFFQSQKSIIAGLIEYLNHAVNAPGRHSQILWTAKDLATACGRMAGNDVNSKLLVEAGVLDGLQTLCDLGDPDEQKEALSALWALAFDDENKENMLKKENLIETLVQLRESSDEGVKTESINTLWTLRDNLRSSSNPEFQTIGENLSMAAVDSSPSSGELGSSGKHIMISYSWDNKIIVFKVHEELEKNGYRVWIDRNEMKGSIIDSIADGVENADAMLMCISQKYKTSKYCRAEAEYAFTRDIHIIPLLMESHFKADGWLGLIKGAKKHFDFSQLDYFDIIFPTLVKEVGQMGKGSVKDKLGDEPVTVSQFGPVALSGQRLVHGTSGHGVVVSKPTNDVSSWSNADAREWLQQNGCLGNTLQKLTGRQLLFLKRLHKEAPDHFYTFLKTDLKLKDIGILTSLVFALDTL